MKEYQWDMDDTISVTSLQSVRSDVTGLRKPHDERDEQQARLTLSTRSPLLKYFTPRLRAAGDYSQFIGIVRGFARNNNNNKGKIKLRSTASS